LANVVSTADLKSYFFSEGNGSVMRHKFFRMCAVLAGISLALATATPCRADLILKYHEDSGADTTVTLASGTPGTFPGLVGAASFSTADFTVVLQTGQAYQLSPNTQLLGATTNILNTGSATHSLTLTLYATGYTAPSVPPPAVLASSLGGSVAIGSSANLLSFQSWANTGTTGTLTGSTTGPQSASITALGGYNTGTGSTLITSLGTPFELVEQMTFTLGAGSNLNYSSSTTLTTVPEPMSMAFVVSGLPFLALYLRRRRARARA